jgi:XdhC and CoxI family
MSLYDRLKQCILDEVPVVLSTVVAGPDAVGSKMLVYADGRSDGVLIDPELTRTISSDAVRLLREERATTVSYR